MLVNSRHATPPYSERCDITIFVSTLFRHLLIITRQKHAITLRHYAYAYATYLSETRLYYAAACTAAYAHGTHYHAPPSFLLPPARQSADANANAELSGHATSFISFLIGHFTSGHRRRAANQNSTSISAVTAMS